MTADELIAKCREFALAPRDGDDDLDAMSPEEAADRGLFCAWWDQRERRKAQAMAAIMAEAHAQVADIVAEKLLTLSPEQLEALNRAASDSESSSR